MTTDRSFLILDCALIEGHSLKAGAVERRDLSGRHGLAEGNVPQARSAHALKTLRNVVPFAVVNTQVYVIQFPRGVNVMHSREQTGPSEDREMPIERTVL